jgi:hypothetical protein
MDIVLGVSMAPASVHMVLLQGENADGATIDENALAIPAADESPTISASDRVIDAIRCIREDAAGAGLELDSIGVAYTDQLEAAVIRDALATHKIENVLLVSAFLAATALTQSVGGAMGYECTALLFVEPDTATLAIVETSDGSVDEVHTEQLTTESVTAELMEMVAELDEMPTRPGSLFVVGSGVDVTPIRRRLEEVTSLVVNVPEEPETALARGAALASAKALASSTAALAYAQDPGTGAIDASALPEYLSIPDGVDGLAYSAVDDDEADAPTVFIADPDGGEPRRRPALLVGTGVAIAGFSAALALEIALSLGIRTTVDSLPAPIKGIIAPVQQALLPAPEVAAMKMVAPKPLSPPPIAPRPAAPTPVAPPVAVPASPAVVVPVPPVAAPAAPVVPVPVFVPPVAPVPVPPVQLPVPPASPPVVEAPPHSSPPIYVPPPKSPPSHRPPPPQGPPPNSGGGEPGNGPGPVRGNPGSGPTNGGSPAGSGGPTGGGPHGGGPHGGGPASGGPPEHGGPPGGGANGGTPAGGPPEHGGAPGGGEPPSGGGPTAAGGSSSGGPTGGGESPGGGGPTGGGSPSSSGGAEVSGGSPSSGGSSSSGGEVSGGSSSSSSSGGSESGSSSSGSSGSGSESSSGSSSSSSGSESGGGHH